MIAIFASTAMIALKVNTVINALDVTIAINAISVNSVKNVIIVIDAETVRKSIMLLDVLNAVRFQFVVIHALLKKILKIV